LINTLIKTFELKPLTQHEQMIQDLYMADDYKSLVEIWRGFNKQKLFSNLTDTQTRLIVEKKELLKKRLDSKVKTN